MAKKEEFKELWPQMSDDDFLDDTNVTDVDIGEYNKEKMTNFIFNINVFRQITHLSDSLKPIERRALYAMYLMGLKPSGKTTKCNNVIGNIMLFHPHGDSSIYSSVIGMSQPWKRSIPLIDISGNYGNDCYSELYAHQRYTEAKLSKYAWECFFEDYDDECVEKVFNTSRDDYEPISLPSKFPNILINGGVGIASGNSFRIPPYNVNDIITLCKRLIDNPDHSNIYITPDLPSMCDIVDDGGSIREICETGTGTLIMRARIDIKEDKYNHKPVWVLKISSIPWLVSMTSINEKLTELASKNILSIKDIQDHSNQYWSNGKIRTMIDFRIIVDKSHDPNVVRSNLFKMTELEKAVSINFKTVMDLTVKELNMRSLVLSWIDERRSYKRRLFNKKISKISARVSLLEILIYILNEDNLERTVKIIRSNNGNEVVNALKEYGNMSSYQALKISEMKLSAFSKDSRDKYIHEKDKLIEELNNIIDVIKSEKKIDKIILSELDDLKKYASERKSNVIASEKNIQVAETNHDIIITKSGLVKKLLYNEPIAGKSTGFGAFKNMDFPIHKITINNLDSLMLFDSLGKFTCIPVYEIDSSESSSTGNQLYNYTKLDGSVVSAFEFINKDTEKYINDKLDQELNIITLTSQGYIKKTKLEEFTNSRSQKNVRSVKLRNNDSLVYANAIFDSANIIVYTKKGRYIILGPNDIPLQGKDSMGVMTINMDDDDECIGLNVIGNDDEFVIVVTEKGSVKKCDMKYFITDMKRRKSLFITSLEPNDNVVYVNGAKDKNSLFICTRTVYSSIHVEELPELSKKAKCHKKIAVRQGDSIIYCNII